jgi:hypothetical protein
MLVFALATAQHDIGAQAPAAETEFAFEARYTLQTSDGVLIMVTNRGIRRGPPSVMARLGFYRVR